MVVLCRSGFILRLRSASNFLLNSNILFQRELSGLQKCFSTTSQSQNVFKQAFTMNGRISLRSAVFIGTGVGFGVIGAYSYSLRKKQNTIEAAQSIEYNLSGNTSIPDARPTRRIKGTADNNKVKLTLYQYQSCPFCCKVRAYLDFKGLSYDVVEVNSVTQKELKWSKYKKVPVLVCETEGERFQLNDSSVIISCLETFFEVSKDSIKKVSAFYPAFDTVDKRGKKVLEFPNKYHIMYGDGMEAAPDKEEIQKWREWTDNVLVHTISPNIYRTPTESYQTFKHFSEVGEWDQTFSWFERNLVIFTGSAVMYIVGKMLKKRHKLSDDVRESLYSACNTWVFYIASKRGAKFAGGDEPNLADLSVYGTLCAMEDTSAFKDSMENADLRKWFYSVKQEVSDRAGKRVSEDGTGMEEMKTPIVG